MTRKHETRLVGRRGQ